MLKFFFSIWPEGIVAVLLSPPGGRLYSSNHRFRSNLHKHRDWRVNDYGKIKGQNNSLFSPSYRDPCKNLAHIYPYLLAVRMVQYIYNTNSHIKIISTGSCSIIFLTQSQDRQDISSSCTSKTSAKGIIWNHFY